MARGAVKAKQAQSRRPGSLGRAARPPSQPAAEAPRERRQPEPAALLLAHAPAGEADLRDPRRALLPDLRVPRRRLGLEQRPRPALQRPEHLRRRRHVRLEGPEGDAEASDDPKGFRDLATAYEAKGDTANAISALQQYTTLRPKDAKVWSELGGLQLTQAQDYVTQYQAATRTSSSPPRRGFRPTGTLGHRARHGSDRAGRGVRSRHIDDRPLPAGELAYSGAISSYKTLVKLQPTNANAEFQLAQAAQTSGDTTTAIAAYKAYLKLNPSSSTAAQIRQLIKQLSPQTVQKPRDPSGRLRRDTEPGGSA